MSRLTGLRRALLGIPVLAYLAGIAWGQTTNQAMGQNVADMKLNPFPGIPGCAVGSAVNGDPAKGPSILFAKTSTGCTVPWHWHTPNEHLMVVKGVGRVEMQSGGAPLTLRAGGYAMMPAKHVHRFHCTGTSSCEFYIYSDGVFDIHYVDDKGNEITTDEALKSVSQSK
jgi:mannose-6-phosphate isomerase-like protein (cupin superfamily)